MVLAVLSVQSAAAERGRYEPNRVHLHTIPGQATGELEPLNSIGSPPLATASGPDVLGLIPTMPASVVLAVLSVQSAAAERGCYETHCVMRSEPVEDARIKRPAKANARPPRRARRATPNVAPVPPL